MELTNFNIAQYFDNKEVISEYLSQILADRDMNEVQEALKNIEKAKGMLIR
ncbi:DNA-binding protein [Arcobacter venerupis]|uniref:helix-turn-helix domain-containing transcriptional regulator n=1 Tax=Arcobacter venerupis TaxID=1054033 RepID=UPI003D27FAF3